METDDVIRLFSLQFSSVAQSCLTLSNPMDCSTPGFPVDHQFLETIQTHVHCVSDASQPSHPLSSPSPPVFNVSQRQGLFKWVSSSHQVAKYWSFSFSISLSNEYLGLISFRSDWFDLLAVWGTLKNLLQHHSSKAYVLQRSAFFYGPTLTSIHDYWKNHSFDIFESLSIITSRYEWMNGHKFIIYSMSSYGDKGKVLAYFFLFVCLIFWMVIQKVFVIISQVELIFIA